MRKDGGSVMVIALLTMSIILTFSLFLIYTYNMEYLILTSSQNAMQGYYFAESKIHSVLNLECYYNLLLPKIEEYLKTGRTYNLGDKTIEIKDEHLLEGDSNKIVKLDFFIEKEHSMLELSTSSTYKGISNNLVSKIYLLNDYYEMEVPIISEDTIGEEMLEDYIEYMDSIPEEIEVPEDVEDIIGIDCSNYERVDIIVEIDGSIYGHFFRKDMETPVKEQFLGKKDANRRIFLVAKADGFRSREVCIMAGEGLEKAVLEGTFYVDGNIRILSNIRVDGILILRNGSIFIESLAELDWNGLILFKDCMPQVVNEGHININYDRHIIKRCGVYVPGFIKPKIKLIKRK